ncbi:MAG: hypothetical protein V2B18_15760, partial [Pseudomonadota bacterium]
KKHIIDLMIESLKGREEKKKDPIKIWKAVAVGLIVLLLVVLVRQTLNLNTKSAVGAVAVGCLLLVVPAAFMLARSKKKPEEADAEAPLAGPAPLQALVTDAQSEDETREALKVLLELHRSGRLRDMGSAAKRDGGTTAE